MTYSQALEAAHSLKYSEDELFSFLMQLPPYVFSKVVIDLQKDESLKEPLEDLALQYLMKQKNPFLSSHLSAEETIKENPIIASCLLEILSANEQVIDHLVTSSRERLKDDYDDLMSNIVQHLQEIFPFRKGKSSTIIVPSHSSFRLV